MTVEGVILHAVKFYIWGKYGTFEYIFKIHIFL